MSEAKDTDGHDHGNTAGPGGEPRDGETIAVTAQGLLAEIDPASAWCQRWRDGRHSWTRRSDGGFDARRYRVETIDETTAKRYVVAHHYAHSYPAAVKRFGLYVDDGRGHVELDALVGVAVFGVPASRAVLANSFDLEPYRESLELSRFVLEGADLAAVRGAGARGAVVQRAPANSESWFLARCFGELARVGIRGIVSFADPVPRRNAAGDVVMPGHVGRIYQASNGVVSATRSTARTLLLLPDATVLSARAVAKVRAQDQGHDYVERLLVTYGARTPRAGEDMGAWLRDAFDAVGVRRVRHRGNWRYCFAVGETRAQRRAVRIKPERGPYPKHVDA